MEYAYKFRIYPNKEQENLIQRTFGCCRFLYNYCLAQRQEMYKQTGKAPTWKQQDALIPKLKIEYPWLKEVDSTALQAAVKNVDVAYQNYFRNIRKKHSPAGYPQFKSKRCRYQSYKSKCVGTNIKILNKAIQLPKLGEIKCRISKEVCGRILSATVSCNPAGKYFVSICCTDVSLAPFDKTGSAIGLDVGIKSFAVSDAGIVYENHKYLRKSEKKLARLQRQLSRKSKDSRRREKARVKVAKLHEHVANQRKDMLHKLSTRLVCENDIICIEDLAPRNMIRNHKLAKSIADASWGEFKRQLTYKTEWYGKQLVVIDRFYPSSQTCSACGEKWNGTKDLKVRKWQCPHCGSIFDRDTNAAINILNEGLRLLA